MKSKKIAMVLIVMTSLNLVQFQTVKASQEELNEDIVTLETTQKTIDGETQEVVNTQNEINLNMKDESKEKEADYQEKLEDEENIENKDDISKDDDNIQYFKSIGWIKENENWYYYDQNGQIVTGWIQDSGYHYYLNNNGILEINQWIGDYYVGNNGARYTNQWIGPYYVGEDGAKYYNKWSGDYYCGNDGKYVKNQWVKDYYCGSDGKYVKNQWVKDYYCGSDGMYIKNQWAGDYYCGSDGMYIKNQWAGNYYCGSDGKYVKNQWVKDYYCGSDGMYIKNQWAGDYYCGSDGMYVKNQWAGDYYCGSDGKYVKNQWIKDYYCDKTGKYIKEKWIDWKGKWYYCDQSGKYLRASNSTQGTIIKGKEYMFNDDGSMKSDEWINDIYIKKSGDIRRITQSDTNSLTQYKMFKYMTSIVNRESVHKKAIQLHGGITNNNCVYFTSELLRRVGISIPNHISYTTRLESELVSRGWKKNYNLNDLKPGDIVFAGTAHAYTFMGWAEDGYAYIVDNQKDKFGTVLHKRDVFKDNKQYDTNKSTHFYKL